MRSFYKMLLGLFIFVSFLYPLKDVKKFDFEKNLSEIEISAIDLNNNVYSSTVNNEVNQFLKNEGYSGTGTTSIVSVNSDNEIIITSVTVSVPDEYSISEVKELLLKKLGINAEVIYKGE